MSPMGTHESLSLFRQRIGDAERAECVEALVEHHVAGRLSREEFEQRQSQAHAAVTFGDLAVLLADLPDTTFVSDRPVVQRSTVARARQRIGHRLALRVAPAGAVVAVAAVVPPVVYDASGSLGVGLFLGSLITGATGLLVKRVVEHVSR